MRVGAVLPLTGSAANYGVLMRRGIEIAEREINATTASKPALRVIVEDSRSNPKDAVSALQKLIGFDRVAAVMPALSTIVLASTPIAESNRIVLLNCPANSPQLRGAGSFVFNLAILSDQESQFLADYAYNTMGARSAGILFVNNDSGRGYQESFRQKFSALGGVIKLREGHDQGATEFRTLIEKFRNSKVDVVFLASYYSESALFLVQARELGYNNRWLSYASIETPDFLKLAGKAAEGVVYSQPGFDLTASDDITSAFVREYRNRFHSDPDFWSAQFYEGTRLLGRAMLSGARTGEDVRRYLKSTRGEMGLTGPISFDASNCVTRSVRFKVVRAGAFQYLPREK